MIFSSILSFRFIDVVTCDAVIYTIEGEMIYFHLDSRNRASFSAMEKGEMHIDKLSKQDSCVQVINMLVGPMLLCIMLLLI